MSPDLCDFAPIWINNFCFIYFLLLLFCYRILLSYIILTLYLTSCRMKFHSIFTIYLSQDKLNIFLLILMFKNYMGLTFLAFKSTKNFSTNRLSLHVWFMCSCNIGMICENVTFVFAQYRCICDHCVHMISILL